MAKGRKTGGRRVGSRNKITVRRDRAIADALAAEILTPEQVAVLEPLQVMRIVMRDRLLAGDRKGALEAAALAAPFCHPSRW